MGAEAFAARQRWREKAVGSWRTDTTGREPVPGHMSVKCQLRSRRQRVGRPATRSGMSRLNSSALAATFTLAAIARNITAGHDACRVAACAYASWCCTVR
ncbi:hypothetical protein EAO74_02995 [Streptomyces sp. gb1(2016)]|uniref:Uncharacterized protein n=1 Tax=Streptomyces sp. gb1(2016) TaxID=1828321 RepID=A0A652LBR1_9ACTN|nr:hypothetical protein EAO74_02995 [Streptomyces sp. gb1(2016)]